MNPEPDRPTDEKTGGRDPALAPALVQPDLPEPTIVNIRAEVINVEAKAATIHQPHGSEHLATPGNSKNKMTAAERSMVWLTGIIAFATVVNVGIFYLESEDTSNQIATLAKKAGGIIDTMNAAFSNNQDAITKAFSANKKAIDDSNKQGKRALDASISVFQIGSTCLDGDNQSSSAARGD